MPSVVEFFLRDFAALREKGCFLLSVRDSWETEQIIGLHRSRMLLAPPDLGFDRCVIRACPAIAQRGFKAPEP